jgi:hypothetical protein
VSSDDAYYDAGVVRDVVEAFARHPEAAMVYGHGVLLNATGLQLQALWAPPPMLFGRQLPMQIVQPAAFVRRAVIEGDFVDESFDIAMDTELWLRIRSRHPIVRLDRIVAVERHHTSRKSYTLSAAAAEELRRLDRSFRPAGGRSSHRRSRAWGLIFRLAGIMLLPRMASRPTAFPGYLDSRARLLARQVLVPRARMPIGS